MNYVHFFQWNIPADNQLTGKTDKYIPVIAEWDGISFYQEGRPMVFVSPVNMTFYEAISVLDWCKAKSDIQKLAENHFAEIARKEKIAQARATLLSEGEPTGVPTLDLYTEKEKELIVQQTLS